MRVGAVLLTSVLAAGGALADPQTYSRTVKLSKGEAKIEFTAAAPDAPHTGPAKSPRVGIAPSASVSFGSFLAQSLDESGKLVVVPPSKLTAANGFQAGFDSMMRSELAETVAAACKQGRLDYILLMGMPQTSMKTDVTAYVMFFGRMRMRNRHDARLYDCRTQKSVWTQSVLFETSQGVLSSGLTGNVMGGLIGGPEAERAMAKVYADKITTDMSW